MQCPLSERQKRRRLQQIRELVENCPANEVVVYEDEVDNAVLTELEASQVMQDAGFEVLEAGGKDNNPWIHIPIGYGRNEEVKNAAHKLHDELSAAGFEVLLDDRDERPGVMFADQELMGIPNRVVVGDRGLKQGTLEYQARGEAQSAPIGLQNALAELKSRLTP